MIRSSSLICKMFAALFLLQCLLQTMLADEIEMFTSEYLDKNNHIRRLRCNGECSTDGTLGSIAIYNVKTLETMALVTTTKVPTSFKPAIRGMSYYVGGLLEKESCFLELIIVNVKAFTYLEVGCNITILSDRTGSPRVVSSQRIIDKTAFLAPLEGSHSVFSTTSIVLVVIIVLLFLSTLVVFLICVRDRRRFRNKVLRQASSQSEVTPSQVVYGDTTSMLSYTKSPSKLSVRTASELKLQATNGSIHRMNSRSESNITAHRTGHLPPPPAPPSKVYWENRPSYTKQSSIYRIATLAYAQPQDTIEQELSEDGDVTSGNSDSQHGDSQSSARYTKQSATYSAVKRVYAKPQDAIGLDLSEDGDVASGNSDSQNGDSQSSGETDSKRNTPLYSDIPVKNS